MIAPVKANEEYHNIVQYLQGKDVTIGEIK